MPNTLFQKIILLFSLLCSGLAFADTEINVGIYAPFSTQFAYKGRNILAAMEMGQEQLKSAVVHYNFYTLDELSNQKDANRVLQKFINIHHINVLITEGAANGLLVAAVAKHNNIIHFSLADDLKIADGKNTFLALTSASEQAGILKPEFIKQFKKEYTNHPSTLAAYAFDVFNLLNQSAVLAMSTKHQWSSEELATQLYVAAEKTQNTLDKNGVLHARADSTSIKNIG